MTDKKVAFLEAELARARARILYLEEERRRLQARAERGGGGEGLLLPRADAERLYDLLSAAWLEFEELHPRRSGDLHEALSILERNLP